MVCRSNIRCRTLAAEDAAFAVLLAAGKPEAGFDELPLLKRMAMVFVDGSAACHVFQRRHEASQGTFGNGV